MNSITFVTVTTPATAILAGVLSSVFGGHEAVFWKGALWASAALWVLYIIAVGLDDIAKHMGKVIKYNAVVLVVVFVGVFAYGKKHDSSGNIIPDASEKNPSDKDFVEQELDNFKSGEGKELKSKIDDLGIQEEQLGESIDKLRAVLVSQDEDPELDETYLDWRQKRNELREKKAELEKKYKKVFVAYQKFKLTPTDEQEKQWKNLLSEGVEEADDLKNQFVSLKKELSGSSTGNSKDEDGNSTDDEPVSENESEEKQPEESDPDSQD